MAHCGPLWSPGVPMEGFKQNHIATPSRYDTIEAILMKRDKIIKQTLGNLHFSVKLTKNSHVGPSGVLLVSLDSE